MKCANCQNPVANEGDYLCRECAEKLMIRIHKDRHLGRRANEAMGKRPS